MINIQYTVPILSERKCAVTLQGEDPAGEADLPGGRGYHQLCSAAPHQAVSIGISFFLPPPPPHQTTTFPSARNKSAELERRI